MLNLLLTLDRFCFPTSVLTITFSIDDFYYCLLFYNSHDISNGLFLINNAPIYDYKLYYWRESDKEVDFVMERYGEVIAIEVKSGRRANNKGLGIFSTTYTPKHAFIVGSGGIPVEEFLQYDIEMFWK